MSTSAIRIQELEDERDQLLVMLESIRLRVAYTNPLDLHACKETFEEVLATCESLGRDD